MSVTNCMLKECTVARNTKHQMYGTYLPSATCIVWMACGSWVPPKGPTGTAGTARGRWARRRAG
eukprot:13266723-Alexandrium_andersonii.AAC.1